MTTWTSALTPGVTFEVVNVTPAIAKEYLEHLPARQRLLSTRTVDRYSNDLLAGEFAFTGDSIKFDADGNLIDGQHRCTAIVEADTTAPVLVIRGLPTEAIRFFDAGRPRTFADDLRIKGYASHSALAAIAARRWHWEHGNYGYMGVPYVMNPMYANTSPTRAQLWRTLDENPGLPETTRHAQRIMRYARNVPLSVLGLSWYLLGEANVDSRESFFHELCYGSEQTGPEYPINVLRRVVTQRMDRNQRRPGEVWLAYIIKAFNAWDDGRTLSYLRMPSPARWNVWPMPNGIERPGAPAPQGSEE